MNILVKTENYGADFGNSKAVTSGQSKSSQLVKIQIWGVLEGYLHFLNNSRQSLENLERFLGILGRWVRAL